MRYSILLILCCSFLFMGCPEDESLRNSFVEYSLNGATCNGLFRIENDMNTGTLDFSALLIPASGGTPQAAIISFADYSTGRQVVFTIPTSSGGGNPILLTHDSDWGMGILHPSEGWELTSGVENTISGVSIDIKKFKSSATVIGLGTIDEMEVHFSGIMTYKNNMNEVEQHTVEGDFYYRPQF